MSINSDIQKLSVDGMITLYELDATKLGAGVLRFHGHISQEDGTREIIWQGQTYTPIPLEVSGLEIRSDGKASAPTLSIANNLNGIQGAISAYCYAFKDFAGATLRVITTLAKYLDAANFATGNPNASDENKTQIWYIEQKTSENAQGVTFELSNPIDFEGLKIPVRTITSYCHWAACGNYRGEECGYTGLAMFNEQDEAVDNPALDRCGGRISSCKARGNENRFGGFVSASLVG